MTRKFLYLLNRTGRYFARLVVPKDLRGIVGKSDLCEPLGPDRREAIRLVPGAVTQMQHQIALAERKAEHPMQTPARYPLAPDQIALSHCNQRLALDDQLRNESRYPAVSIADLLVGRLREAVSGKANDVELGAFVGAQIERIRGAGKLDAKPGSDE